MAIQRTAAMSKVDRIRELRHVMWRNTPGDGVRATNAACERCRKGSARGGGLCFDCAKTEMGELVGRGMATGYAVAILKIRELEAGMDEKAGGYDVV